MQFEEWLVKVVKEHLFIIVQTFLYQMSVYPKEYFHKNSAFNNKLLVHTIPSGTNKQLHDYIKDTLDIAIRALRKGKLHSILISRLNLYPQLNEPTQFSPSNINEWRPDAQIQIAFKESVNVQELRNQGWSETELMQFVHSSASMEPLIRFISRIQSIEYPLIESNLDVSFELACKCHENDFNSLPPPQTETSEVTNDIKDSWQLLEHWDNGIFSMTLLEKTSSNNN